MSSRRRSIRPLYYFTVEDENLLSEVFSDMGDEVFAVAYKVRGTDDVFVMTADTKDAMDRRDVHYNLLAEEDGSRIAVQHSPLSREELADYEDSLKALALACRAIGVACVGVNGEGNLGFDLSGGAKQFTYFTAPAGHTFIFRLFQERDEAVEFLDKLTMGDKKAVEWAKALPLESSKELRSYH